MTLLSFRSLNVLAAGVGYYCASSLSNWKKNSFKVNAQILKTAQWKDEKMVFHLGRYGIPKRDVLLDFEDVQASYDNKYKTANWVLEHLTYRNLQKVIPNLEKESDDNVADDNVADIYRADICDYEEGNVHKLRLLAGDNHKYSEESFDATRTFSTFAGVNPSLACSFWPALEAYTRYLTYFYKDIYVFTGPLYLAKEGCPEMDIDVFGKNQVAYATHFYKIIFGRVKGTCAVFDVGCYLVPNRGVNECDSLSCYRVNLCDVELKGGFKMFKEQVAYDQLGEIMNVKDFRAKRKHYMTEVGLGCVM